MKRALLIATLSLVSTVLGMAQEKPRVFVTDSQSWEISGGGGGANGAFGTAVKGGARPQTAEVIKTFGEKCPDVVINNRREKADYVVLLDHEGGKGWARKDNKVAVFNADGDTIVSHSTRSLGGSVEDACRAITKDWAAKASKHVEYSPAKGTGATTAAQASETTGGKLSIGSQPQGADIEIDGAFVGSTPSSVVVPSGTHLVVVKKNGFRSWERTLKVTGGNISLTPELEPAK